MRSPYRVDTGTSTPFRWTSHFEKLGVYSIWDGSELRELGREDGGNILRNTVQLK